MDVLTVGIQKGTTDATLFSSLSSYEEIELLDSGYNQQQETDLFSLNLSPHSDISSFGESGITSPGNLFDDDFLDGLLNEELSPSIKTLTVEKPVESIRSTTVPSKTISPPASGSKNITRPSTMTYDPKVKIYQDGQRLSDGQIERNRKNAIAAKMNRQKKKEYLTNLEDQVKALSTENTSLSEKCGQMEVTINELQHEVLYLKSVLANESALSSVLTGLPSIKGVQLRVNPSLMENRPPLKRVRREGEEDRVLTTKKVKSDSSLSSCSGGICLHIAGQIASLEMCWQCSQRAARRDAPL